MAVISMLTYCHQQSLTGSNGMRVFSSSSRDISTRSMSSGGESSGGNISEIGEGMVEEVVSSSTSVTSSPSRDVEGKVFVAVGRETRDGISTLVWVLRNNPTLKKLVLVHVHRRSSLIPMMGGWFRPSQLTVQQVNLYRQKERDKMKMILDEYESFCMRSKVQVERLSIEMDDIAKGLVYLIAQNGITKFVMGAAADKNYYKKMKIPKSKTASTVQREAPLSCKIWFVCKENLICTREANGYGVVSPMESPNTTPSWTSMSISSENYHDETTSSEMSLSTNEDGSQLAQEPVDDPQVSSSETHLAGISRKMYYNQVIHKNEMEAALEREKLQVDQLKQLQIVPLEELDNAQRKKSALEKQIEESNRAVKDLEDKLLSADCLIKSLQMEINKLKKERENAISGAKEMKQNKEEAISSGPSYFSYSDLEKATREFESSSIIGEGGYGRVHKGYLRCTQVAIKLLHPDNTLQGKPEFYQEVDILGRVRHPNLVTLIGTCPEACALVYEFLPNGSLEDRLARSPPLSWQVRTRISYEVCCALVFLHSAKPFGIVHGDLKPANILLDANLVSKLSDFGISRFLIESATTHFHMTTPKGTLAYMDPEFMLTGELTPQSDVYSFGITLLRLLTGRPATAIAKAVKEAIDNGKLEKMIDPTAGNWPLHQARQLAQLGIRCCEMERKNRPNLIGDVWRLLDQMNNSSSSFSSSSSFKEDENGIPPYFICPIYKEIMKDPYVAADGHTYEAEAIKARLKCGKKISAKTNLKLSHEHLVPNHSLRAAIEDWQRRSHA